MKYRGFSVRGYQPIRAKSGPKAFKCGYPPSTAVATGHFEMVQVLLGQGSDYTEADKVVNNASTTSKYTH